MWTPNLHCGGSGEEFFSSPATKVVRGIRCFFAIANPKCQEMFGYLLGKHNIWVTLFVKAM
jgi:hypothetical protein